MAAALRRGSRGALRGGAWIVRIPGCMIATLDRGTAPALRGGAWMRGWNAVMRADCGVAGLAPADAGCVRALVAAPTATPARPQTSQRSMPARRRCMRASRCRRLRCVSATCPGRTTRTSTTPVTSACATFRARAAPTTRRALADGDAGSRRLRHSPDHLLSLRRRARSRFACRARPKTRSKPDASVFLIDADTGSPDAFERVAGRRALRRGRDGVALAPGEARARSCRAALCGGRDARRARRRRARRSSRADAFARVRDSDASVLDARRERAARAAYAPVLGTLANAGVARDRVAALAVFHVQTRAR